MKIIKNIKTAIVLLGILFTGCSGYLEEENLGNTTAENYYTTEKGYEELVNAGYASLRNIYQPTPYMFCAGTDLFFSAHDEVPAGLASYQNLTPGTAEVDVFFSTLYQSIQKTNLGLAYADKTEDFSALKTRIAELKLVTGVFSSMESIVCMYYILLYFFTFRKRFPILLHFYTLIL